AVSGTYHAKVPLINRENGPYVQSFCYSDDQRIDKIERCILIQLNECTCSLIVFASRFNKRQLGRSQTRYKIRRHLGPLSTHQQISDLCNDRGRQQPRWASLPVGSSNTDVLSVCHI